jgi:hypothetical protein
VGNTALTATVDTSPVVLLPPKVAAALSGYPRHKLVRMGDAGILTVERVGCERRFHDDEIRALPPYGGAA